MTRWRYGDHENAADVFVPGAWMAAMTRCIDAAQDLRDQVVRADQERAYRELSEQLLIGKVV